MKKLFIVMIILLVITASSGCSTLSTIPIETNTTISDETPKVLEDQYSLVQEAATEYLEQASLEVITADEVYQKVVVQQDLDYFVVDVRSASDFAKGSVEGAVNIPYQFTAQENMIKNLPKDKKIITVCYTGHWAGQTAALWSMLGYEVTPMLNGISGWNKAVSSLPKGSLNYPTVTEVYTQENTYDLPVFEDTDATSIDSLLLTKSNEYINSDKGVTVTSENLEADINIDSTYFIIDIRDAKDYNAGHIAGAVNLSYQTIMNSESLAKIPNNQPLVIVGYNGSDASQLTRILSILGYDTYALKYGMRSWATDVNYSISINDLTNYPLKELQYDTENNGEAVVGCG